MTTKQKLYWTIGLASFLGSLLGTLARADDYSDKLSRLLVVRQKALTASSQIQFEAAWKPNVILDIPAGIHPARTYDFGGRYEPATRTFIFNPKYMAALNRLPDELPETIQEFFQAENDLRSKIDHELGHALVHDIARRSGYTLWYDVPAYEMLIPDDQIAITMLSEGLATFFERLTTSDRSPKGYGLLPHTWQDPSWRLDKHNIIYEGGYWIVYPIVQDYGEKGIVYVLSHQLHFPNGNADDAGLAYQKQALIDLGKH